MFQEIPISKNYEINWTVRIDQTIHGYEELDAAKNVLALPQSVIHFSILSKYWEIGVLEEMNKI